MSHTGNFIKHLGSTKQPKKMKHEWARNSARIIHIVERERQFYGRPWEGGACGSVEVEDEGVSHKLNGSDTEGRLRTGLSTMALVDSAVVLLM
jgi:hypothetical protein